MPRLRLRLLHNGDESAVEVNEARCANGGSTEDLSHIGKK